MHETPRRLFRTKTFGCRMHMVILLMISCGFVHERIHTLAKNCLHVSLGESESGVRSAFVPLDVTFCFFDLEVD